MGENDWGGSHYAINNLDPRVVYATAGKNILITRDGGNDWSVLYAFASNVSHIAIAPSDSSVLYTNADGRIYKSTDSGLTWQVTSFNSGGSPIAVNPHDSNVVYIGTRIGVSKTIDGGDTWQVVLSTEWVNDILINPVDATTVYVCTGNFLSGSVGNVFRSTNNGDNWVTLNEGLPTPYNRYLNSLLINPQNPVELYVGTYGWGVYKTTNSGINWQWTNVSAAGVLDIYVDPDSSGDLYAGTADEGILMTPDEGQSWRALDFGIPQTVQSFFRQFTFDPNDRSIAYATGGPYGLFKSTDQGNHWQLTTLRGSFDTWIWTIAVHPRSSDTLYVGQTGSGSRDLHRSTDAGATWQNLNATNSEAAVEAIVFDPNDPLVMYIAATGKGVLKTMDGGTTWIEKNEGIRIADPGDLPSRNPVMSLAVSNESIDILYTVQRASGAVKGGIYFTRDGGERWLSIDSTLEVLDQNLSGNDVLIGWGERRKIYVTLGSQGQHGTSSFSEGGLFSTTDNGKTWIRLFAPVRARSSEVGAISADPHDQKAIYIGTDYGIVRFIDSTIKAGDINNDGRVDVVDLIRVFNIILDVPPAPTDQERTAADVNRDGQIDVRDLIAIINIILGIS